MEALTIVFAALAGLFFLLYLAKSKEVERLKEENARLEERVRTSENTEQVVGRLMKSELMSLYEQILKENVKDGLDRYKADLAGLILPLKESMQKYDQNVESFFRNYIEKATQLNEALNKLHDLENDLDKRLASFADIFRSDSRYRGLLGEIHLQNLLNKLGLKQDQDYFYQYKVNDLRLDFVINLPGRKLIIDSKWPLTKYEEFIRTEDKDEQEKKLKELVSAFKNTIRDLAGRRYWEYLDDSTGFVLLYVPNDSFLSLVLSKDPGIFSYAVEKNIILVSPSSILPALVLIAEIIRYTKVMDEFEQVYRQIDNFMQLTDQFEAKAADLGKNLDKTVAAFNTLVGFWKKIKVDFDWKTLKDVALEQKQKKRNELNVLDSKTKNLD